MATDLLTANEIPTTAIPTNVADRGQPMSVRPDESFELETETAGVEAVATSEDATSSLLADFVELTKPRIVTMVLVTTVATAFLGAGGVVGIVPMVWLLIGTGMVAASAGAANQVWERVIDRNMTRTASRPLPAGRLGLFPAVVYTAALGMVGSAILWTQFSPAPAIAGIVTWATYVLIYTPMKTRTAWNTTVGAVAGALPVLIGYLATGGAITDMTGWLLVGVLAAWQYPHFMAIAWLYRRQYDEAGFKMTTTVEPTGKSAGWQAVVGSVAVIICGLALCVGGKIGIAFAIASMCVIASVYPMLNASRRFLADPNDQTARTLLRSSLLVLPAVLLIVTIRIFV